MGSSNKKRSNNNNMEHRTGLKQINNTKVRQSTKSKENKNITECLWVRYKRRKCHVAFLLISSFKFFFYSSTAPTSQGLHGNTAAVS